MLLFNDSTNSRIANIYAVSFDTNRFLMATHRNRNAHVFFFFDSLSKQRDVYYIYYYCAYFKQIHPQNENEENKIQSNRQLFPCARQLKRRL